MYPAISGMFISMGLSLAMFVALEIGHRVGVRAMARDSEAQRGTGAVEGAVFGLIGLILAFTFSGAQSRFETRRNLIVEEASAISTAYDRLDLLPGSRSWVPSTHWRPGPSTSSTVCRMPSRWR